MYSTVHQGNTEADMVFIVNFNLNFLFRYPYFRVHRKRCELKLIIVIIRLYIHAGKILTQFGYKINFNSSILFISEAVEAKYRAIEIFKILMFHYTSPTFPINVL